MELPLGRSEGGVAAKEARSGEARRVAVARREHPLPSSGRDEARAVWKLAFAIGQQTANRSGEQAFG